MIAAATPSVPDLRSEPSYDTNVTNVTNETTYCNLPQHVGAIFCDDATRFKITYVLIISMALSQMPAIALGVFGVMRAFMIHGASPKAVVDCLRLKQLMSKIIFTK